MDSQSQGVLQAVDAKINIRKIAVSSANFLFLIGPIIFLYISVQPKSGISAMTKGFHFEFRLNLSRLLNSRNQGIPFVPIPFISNQRTATIWSGSFVQISYSLAERICWNHFLMATSDTMNLSDSAELRICIRGLGRLLLRLWARQQRKCSY